MKIEWPIKKLEELATDVTVGFVGSMSSEYITEGIPFLRSLNVEPFNINKKDLKFIGRDFHKKLKKSSLKPGDVVIVRTGKPGSCVVIPEWLSTANCSDLVIVRCGESIRPHFLCYWINSVASHHISSHLVGAVQQHFNVGSAKKMEIPVPTLEEQDEIINILGSIDNRISLLRETNLALESLAQTLFKSWFIDFDPIHANADGREPEGMDAETAALFPDGFEESEVGLIPKRWRIGALGDIACVKGGFAYKSNDFNTSGNPVVKIKNIVGDGTVDLNDTAFISNELAEKTKKFKLHDGNIIIAMTGATIGKMGIIVTERAHTPYLNQRVAKFESKLNHNDCWFIFVAFQNKFISDQVTDIASGSAQANISTNGIEAVRLILPDNNRLLDAFNTAVAPLFARWIENQKQIKTIVDLRDTLLPRLISGQLNLGVA